MIWILFGTGLLMALACGARFTQDLNAWSVAALWLSVGFSGIGLMILAILLRKWGF